MKVFPDTVVYTFCSNLAARAEDQRTYPLHFQIKLPPKLLSTYAAGMESFGFQYGNKQVIYVWVDYGDAMSVDTSYRIGGEKEITALLLDKLNMINDDTRLDIDNNPFNSSKDTWLIKRGKATILLYNINKEDSARFCNYAASFIFL